MLFRQTIAVIQKFRNKFCLQKFLYIKAGGIYRFLCVKEIGVYSIYNLPLYLLIANVLEINWK
jgi:hypothetical protein